MMTNSDRARRALPAVQAYAETGFDVTDDQDMAHQAFGDLLCDLRHLADRLGVDFDAANRRGGDHYFDEGNNDEQGDWPMYIETTS